MKSIYDVPRFHSIRIYLVASVIFFMLVFPISLIMLFKYGPFWLEEKNAFEGPQKVEMLTIFAPDSLESSNTLKPLNSEISKKSSTVALEPDDLDFKEIITWMFRMLLVGMVLGFVWNYPFKLYFRNKRKGRYISPKLETHCRQWLLQLPLTNALVVAFSFFVVLYYMVFQFLTKDFHSELTRDFHRQFLIITALGAALTTMFVYFWFRHRVRFIYLEHVFDSVSLYKASTKRYRDHIVRRLWVNSLMTTLLPLAIVIFYISLSKTPNRLPGDPQLNSDQIKVLFGKYTPLIEQTNLFQSEHLFYVNSIDSLLMFVGIFSGILISIIYLFFFVNWTHFSIVIPLKEVVEKMRHPIENEIDRLAILRTDDEIGELANGYNEMALRITKNLRSLSLITEANQRFVPIQFLQMLGKKSITDVAVGDQVQKHMTILFIDIRSFTSLSEQLTPKENFDFLNDYLGFMEPVIRSNNGFVDKFIGDSIMALFHEQPLDAVKAAIEMRRQLKLFNRQLHQQGRPEIETGTGIHTGNLILGVVGGAGRIETTVISDAVNLASRLEGLTRSYAASIIVSEATLAELPLNNDFFVESIGEVLVKGRKKSVAIFAISQPESIEIHQIEATNILLTEAKITALKSIVTKQLNKVPHYYPYHDLNHTFDVYEAAYQSAKHHQINAEEQLILLSAALLHETGMAEGHQDHEEKSIAFTRNTLPLLCYNNAQIEQISQLIRCTKMPQSPFNLLSNILCDSDLDYLGRADYVPLSEKLRQEWIINDGFSTDRKVWLESQVQFLKEHQHFTLYSQKNRKEGKLRNLKQVEEALKAISNQA